MEPKSATQILVVEDDENDSFLLMREIERAQLDDHVTVIDKGRTALEFLTQAEIPPLAIFLDLYLPDLNGVQLLDQLRHNPKYMNTPIIVMTGSVNPNDLKECLRLGVTAYLPKPVRLTSFIKTVAHLFPKVAVPH
jgi:CheY-like chemotaxis protein